MTGAVEGGDCYLEIRRSLRALGFVAQLREGRPPCCSTRDTERFLIFQQGLESWAVGLPTKLCLLALWSQTPGLGSVLGARGPTQRGACFTPSCWNKYAGGLSDRLTEVCLFPW